MELPDAPADLETQFKAMNRAMALVLLEDCYDVAMAENASFNAKLDLLKLNVKLGELEPKQAAVAPGSGVQFIINLPSIGGAPAQTLTIDAAPHAEDGEFSMDLTPPRPAFLPAQSDLVFPDA